jgi:thiosulfate reductase cytochrome b subunit
VAQEEGVILTLRVYMYSRYERGWHWLQATTIIALVITGLEIHAPEVFGIAGFEVAVMIHRTLGFLLIANAFLGLLYHLMSGEIRQYFASSRDFVPLAARQASFYLKGIFRGQPHPFEKRPERKLNPLQRVVYVAILNILLPLQVVTGLLLWGAHRWPETVGAIGGLATLAAVHTAGAWIFLTFMTAHVYLITAGRTPFSNLRAMITGWDETESTPETEALPAAEPEETVGTAVRKDEDESAPDR